MRARALLPLLLAGLAVAACDTGGVDALDGARLGLRDARARWDSAGVADYRLSYAENCFCAVQRFTVVVRGGAVDSVYAGGGDEPLVPVAYDPARHFGVPGLFALVEAGLDRRPEVAEVVYNTELGFPSSASFDYDRSVLDEEDGFTLFAFETLDEP